ncbi:MAG: polysaccharide pyruvyl transferase family protein [Coprococcus sp.]
MDRIKKFCTKYDLEMVAIGAPQFWIKKFIVCTPFQCLKLFEEAEYVITDTFHGTIFSIRANVKFCTLIRKSNENKLNSLLKTLRRADRRVNKLGDIERLYKEEIDYSETNNIIEIEREKTMKYLKENMINE